jgi:Ca-activated chloride channel family protein
MTGVAHPLALLLLVAAPAAGWLAVRRRTALRYPSLTLVAGLPRGRAVWATWGTAGLRGLAVALFAVAAAGPRRPDLRTRVPSDGIAIVTVLDVSGSMAEADYGPDRTTRLAAAKAVLKRFALGGDGFAGRPADQLGLVAFAAVPRTACPLTLNHAVLVAVAEALEPAPAAEAGTNLGDALAEAIVRADAAGDRRKVLVVLSDGEQNADRAGVLKPRAAAQLAANLGVVVHCVDCGGDPTADPDAVQRRADGRATLEAVAALGGGRCFAAADPAGLREAYRQIDALETRPADGFRYRRYVELAPACGLAGLGLLAVGGLLEATRWRRRPG